MYVVPSSVNSLYTPLGLPVIGEQKRLSTYWSARAISSAGRTNTSARRTNTSARRTSTSAGRASASAAKYREWMFIQFAKGRRLYINKVLAWGEEKGLSGLYHTKWLEVYPLRAIARMGKRQ